jgi:DNA (cytosine-5)-methyltransferase 1
VNELALFAGHGGGILGGHLLGWRTVCAVESDGYARRVLMSRQDDGCLPPFPIWDDVRTFDGRPWAGRVDVISGGFPCQDISVAGKGEGITGARSGLWGEFARIIREVGPAYVFVENSPALTARGLGTVLGDLAAMGFDARWGVLGAVHAGAPHRRERIWIVANRKGHGWQQGQQDAGRCGKGMGQRAEQGSGDGGGAVANTQGITQREPPDQDDAFAACREARDEPVRCGEPAALANSSQQRHGPPTQALCTGRDTAEHGGQSVAHANSLRQLQPQGGQPDQWGWVGNSSGEDADDPHRQRQQEQRSTPELGGWWSVEPDVGRVALGVASRVDRLCGLGNGQVPAVVALAWCTLK